MPNKTLPRILINKLALLKNKVASLSFFEKLSLAVSFISSLSLIFIWYQVSQTSSSLQASAYATIGNYTMELDKIFVSNPELRPYFYDGETITEEQDKKKYHQVMAIAELQLDFFDATLTQLDIRPRESKEEMEKEKQAWNAYFASSFAKSPLLCKRFNENRDWYRDNLQEIADGPCKKASPELKP